MPPAPTEPRLAPEPRVSEPSRSMAATVALLGTNERRRRLGANPKLVTRGGPAFLYIRGELPLARRQVERAGRGAGSAGRIGPDILGSGFALEITVSRGAGAYFGGEESALRASLEAKRGYPRLKPPFP